eukprot:CAMPEP_0197178228 /NCGR_PEP_ID=MMETSP1423-20130617/3583_1 /TAXON_ID=476441 /ORGANISM="Pseudo-nitzschia heimii, Strain UNC1101" /LENGTH=130 /DNA_ID=CAMNT_0042627935 /DNA_START=104 /DNA_END=496 /DNA_ORIENTATION=-
MPEDNQVEKASSDAMALAIDKAKPIIAKVSFGSLMGFCSGYALKQVGKIAAVVLGAGFIAVQTAVSYGYIKVDWDKVKDDAIKKVDTDGDGKLGADDMKIYWEKLKGLLTANLPNSGGFSLGFFYGIKQG